ncbi:hypothetical protein [Actinoplanes siamensis]|uniref:Uncharacterized protein n=1 Tax=Actinoplanes siamensis TaxID=1223317 RepID=A0A919TKR9_9ACTN|nr:hypothetical protein [Actinoplanes siamensis]GIF05559.1 hypothetical protein Asi03nite_30970 [Actinoplanes siamensis]
MDRSAGWHPGATGQKVAGRRRQEVAEYATSTAALLRLADLCANGA